MTQARVDQTETRKEDRQVSTLNISEQTHQQVLLQPAALENAVADKQQGTHETDRIPPKGNAGVQHGREEIADAPVRARQRHSGVQASEARREPQPHVFVLSKDGHPLDPTHPARARKLLRTGRAVVVSRFPFAIRLKDRTVAESTVQGVAVGVDPGSKTTGIAVWKDNAEGVREPILLAEVDHRGAQIRKRMEQRSNYRRRRRSKNLRYRAPRFNNRTRPKGWLAPSLQHRVDSTVSVMNKIKKRAPVNNVVQELVRFDTQQMEHPEISGVEYQQGTLLGYEVREYLLEKWGRQCVYCDAMNVPLTIDHILARSNGGSDRISNLTLACSPCNQDKDDTLIEDYLAHDPERLARINRTRTAPLRDAAAVNTTRWALWQALGQPTVGTGGHTKYNRSRFGLPKTHALDALAVGHPDTISDMTNVNLPVLVITSNGRGQHQRTTPDKHGFPRLSLPRQKFHHGFQTGDTVRAVVPTGKKQGTYTGRVAVRARGFFNVGPVQGINHKHVRLLSRADGYSYHYKEGARDSSRP